MPKLPQLNQRDTQRADHGGKDLRTGFSFDLWLKLDSLQAGQMLLDNRDESGRGILVATTQGGAIRVLLDDGRTQASWDSDQAVLHAGLPQHVVITVDGGPTAAVNGINAAYVSVTICQPGSSTNCQVIDHVLLDLIQHLH